jgi:hypothetical protein
MLHCCHLDCDQCKLHCCHRHFDQWKLHCCHHYFDQCTLRCLLTIARRLHFGEPDQIPDSDPCLYWIQEKSKSVDIMRESCYPSDVWKHPIHVSMQTKKIKPFGDKVYRTAIETNCQVRMHYDYVS